MRTRKPLIAHLVEHGWFSRMGEPAVTQLVEVLLEEPELNGATLSLIRSRCDVDVSGVRRWRSETVQEDLARTDLEGLDDRGVPVVIVEMKFGAELSSGQMLSYIRTQERLLQGQPGVVVALVPEVRLPEAEAALAAARAELGEGASATLAISWDDWLEVWEAAGTSQEVGADVIQLRGLCAAMSGLVMPPFATEPKADWAERQGDLLKLVDIVTRSLTPAGSRVSGMGGDEYAEYAGRRYFGPAMPTRSAVSLGLVGNWAAEGDAALWLRFHKETAGFAEVRHRLRGSTLLGAHRDLGGHIWLPVHLPLNAAGEHLAGGVEACIRAVLADLQLTI